MADRCALWSTDKGTVQKVIVLPRDDLQTEELVLEEVEVFKVRFYTSLYFTLPPLHFPVCSLFCSFDIIFLFSFSNLLVPLYIHFHLLQR